MPPSTSSSSNSSCLNLAAFSKIFTTSSEIISATVKLLVNRKNYLPLFSDAEFVIRESTETLEALSNRSALSWFGNKDTKMVDWPST